MDSKAVPWQSFTVWRLESLSLFSLGVQSHMSSQFGRSKPSSIFSYGVQTCHIFTVWCLEPLSLISFNVQSHHIFSVWVFRATISFQFGVQSHHPFLVWRSGPPSIISYDIQVIFLSSTFRVVLLSFGVQSHNLFLVWVFRATISSQFGHSKPQSLFSLAFRATIPSQFNVQSLHLLQYWRSKLHLQLDVQSRPIFSVTTFRVVLLSLTFRDVNSQLWRSEPPSTYISVFRVIIVSQLRRLESSFSV